MPCQACPIRSIVQNLIHYIGHGKSLKQEPDFAVMSAYWDLGILFVEGRKLK